MTPLEMIEAMIRMMETQTQMMLIQLNAVHADVRELIQKNNDRR